jgi:hypothetical protein
LADTTLQAVLPCCCSFLDLKSDVVEQEQTHAAYLGRLRQINHLLKWQREQVQSKLATALQLLENAEGEAGSACKQ